MLLCALSLIIVSSFHSYLKSVDCRAHIVFNTHKSLRKVRVFYFKIELVLVNQVTCIYSIYII